jgi:hypothetical protein
MTVPPEHYGAWTAKPGPMRRWQDSLACPTALRAAKPTTQRVANGAGLESNVGGR